MAKKKVYWFPLYMQNQGAIEEIDDAKVGKALKAAMRYFNSKQRSTDEAIEERIPDLETRIAFRIFRQGVDETLEYREKAREWGATGPEAKKEKAKQAAAADEMMEKYGGEEPEMLPYK